MSLFVSPDSLLCRSFLNGRLAVEFVSELPLPYPALKPANISKLLSNCCLAHFS
jgi:hypothetical protein